jgi:hypothetical protein
MQMIVQILMLVLKDNLKKKIICCKSGINEIQRLKLTFLIFRILLFIVSNEQGRLSSSLSHFSNALAPLIIRAIKMAIAKKAIE